MSKTARNKEGKIINNLRDLLAPGASKVRAFAIPVKLAPQKNGVRVDWKAFRNSEVVMDQLRATAKLDLSGSQGEQRPTATKR